MSNKIINIRFGTRHLQVERSPFRVKIYQNPHWVKNTPKTFVKVYKFFSYGSTEE